MLSKRSPQSLDKIERAAGRRASRQAVGRWPRWRARAVAVATLPVGLGSQFRLDLPPPWRAAAAHRSGRRSRSGAELESIPEWVLIGVRGWAASARALCDPVRRGSCRVDKRPRAALTRALCDPGRRPRLARSAKHRSAGEGIGPERSGETSIPGWVPIGVPTLTLS